MLLLFLLFFLTARLFLILLHHILLLASRYPVHVYYNLHSAVQMVLLLLLVLFLLFLPVQSGSLLDDNYILLFLLIHHFWPNLTSQIPGHVLDNIYHSNQPFDRLTLSQQLPFFLIVHLFLRLLHYFASSASRYPEYDFDIEYLQYYQ